MGGGGRWGVGEERGVLMKDRKRWGKEKVSALKTDQKGVNGYGWSGPGCPYERKRGEVDLHRKDERRWRKDIDGNEKVKAFRAL